VPIIKMAVLSRNDRLRPVVSATTPVGISNRIVPTVNAEFAMKTSKMLSPASSRNSVLTPQITDADSVNRPEITR
jgi:hypothetical protein